MILDMGLIMTYVSVLTALHAALALLQAHIWKIEKLWDAKKIFVLSLVYFPIGFLGVRAWRIYSLKKNHIELIAFLILLFLFFGLFFLLGLSNLGLARAMTWQFNFGIDRQECLSTTWPFSTPIWILSFLCNLLIFHHLAWPVFEIIFLGIRKYRRR